MLQLLPGKGSPSKSVKLREGNPRKPEEEGKGIATYVGVAASLVVWWLEELNSSRMYKKTTLHRAWSIFLNAFIRQRMSLGVV